MNVLGIDIGGSGIKGALVDLESGEFASERIRLVTPDPSTPEAVAKVVHTLVKKMDYTGPVGAGFPGVIQHGVCFTAANIDQQWINTNVEKLFSKKTGNPFTVINDADAAVKVKKELSWKEWAAALDEYLRIMEDLFWPDLIIIGGGISRNHGKYFGYLQTRTKIVPAQLYNQAGIIGAAYFASLTRVQANP